MVKKVMAGIAMLACLSTSAYAESTDFWIMNTKKWSCLFGPTTEMRDPIKIHDWAVTTGVKISEKILDKYPDGSVRIFEQTIYKSDGNVQPLWWFANQDECLSAVVKAQKANEQYLKDHPNESR